MRRRAANSVLAIAVEAFYLDWADAERDRILEDMFADDTEEELAPGTEDAPAAASAQEPSAAESGDDLAGMFGEGEAASPSDKAASYADGRQKKTYQVETTETDDRPAVLVVDDSSMARTMVCHVVEKLGYRAVQAADGVEAIAQARYHEPSLIFLDIVMPGPSGLDILRELRSDPKFQTTPIIMLTVESKRQAIQTAMAHQVNDYLVKPVDAKEIAKRIEKYLPSAENPDTDT